MIFLFTAEMFDEAKFLDTHPDLVNRVYNRPRMETLRSQPVISKLDDDTLMVRKILCY